MCVCVIVYMCVSLCEKGRERASTGEREKDNQDSSSVSDLLYVFVFHVSFCMFHCALVIQ